MQIFANGKRRFYSFIEFYVTLWTFWFIKKNKVQVISSSVPDSVIDSISSLSLATHPPPIKISVIYISIAADFFIIFHGFYL